jgi:hypothetical protein
MNLVRHSIQFCTRMEKMLRTSGNVLFRHFWNAFGKDHSEAPVAWR